MVKPCRVVIVGAGFGGLQTAQSLANSGADVLLIDSNNYHTFVPLLYQVATGQIAPEQIAYPARTILRRASNINFLMAEVEEIDFSAQIVKTDNHAIAYNFLVIATGSRTQYLGVPGALDYTLGMRTLEEAITLRNHIFSCLEKATQESDPTKRQELLTFAIVGGGATGVEIAGAVVEILRGRVRRDYPTLDLREVRVILIQSGDRLLADLPKKLGVYTYNRLRKLGVEVYLEAKVSKVNLRSIYIDNHQEIATATTIWTAGLEANSPTEDISTGKKGKLLVNSTLQSSEYANVYAIGDVAYVDNDKPLSGVAPEALQMGVAVARNIKRQLRGQLPQPFNYFNKGRLAIIGCYSGVGKIGGFAFTGFLPWLMWLGVHLVYLPGYRSRVVILLTWIHGYLLGDRAVRLILSSKETNITNYRTSKTR
jgi:NADH dehydrogenase